ncbi:MAG: bifunctional nuclease family protein [SAR202 cluster bacterium]|nr:bifunctional nuclease family protein [SAR202 cluster bacterium]
MLEMVIDSIRVSLMNYQRVVILKQREAERYLPIWIGSPEADAIAVKLQDVSVPRPLTHDLLGSVIKTLGARVERVVVSDLSNDTFFAKLVLARDGENGAIEVDCRPSDAIAVAVRASVPIYVEDMVLDKAGIVMDKETGKPMMDETARKGDKGQAALSEEEIKNLSAFSDFLKDLKGLDELGKS